MKVIWPPWAPANVPGTPGSARLANAGAPPIALMICVRLYWLALESVDTDGQRHAIAELGVYCAFTIPETVS